MKIELNIPDEIKDRVQAALTRDFIDDGITTRAQHAKRKIINWIKLQVHSYEIDSLIELENKRIIERVETEINIT